MPGRGLIAGVNFNRSSAGASSCAGTLTSLPLKSAVGVSRPDFLMESFRTSDCASGTLFSSPMGFSVKALGDGVGRLLGKVGLRRGANWVTRRWGLSRQRRE